MAITEKKPPLKLTVGAQYICFNTDDDWDASDFESTTYKFPTVVNITVADGADSYESYASGDVYDADTIINYKEIQTSNLAFEDDILAQMRGDTVTEGIIMSGGLKKRPYFAYGVPIIKKDGTLNMKWYPKCKLVENSDSTATSTDKHSDQTDTLTIRAYGFNSAKETDVSVLTGVTANAGITEDAFFAAPVLTVAAAQALRPVSGTG